MTNNINYEVGMINNNQVQKKKKDLNYEKEMERYHFLRRYNENRFMKIMKLRKDKGHNPEPGRYNPNYNMIKKRMPNIIFEHPLYSPSASPKNPPEEAKQKPQSTTSKKTNKDINTPIKQPKELKQSTNRKDKMLLQDVIKDINKENSFPSIRKSISERSIFKINTIKSYPFKKIRGVYFNKMLGRKNKVLISDAPAAGTYNPNYSYVTKDDNCVIFDGGNREPMFYKKALIQKVLHSYSISDDYSVMKLKKHSLNHEKKIRERATKVF